MGIGVVLGVDGQGDDVEGTDEIVARSLDLH
jgi:hypothetical protein